MNLTNTVIRFKTVEGENYTLFKVMNASELTNPLLVEMKLCLCNARKGIVFTGNIPALLLLRLYEIYKSHPFLALDCGSRGYLIFHSNTDTLKVGLPVPR